jgi:hypothetical protein
MQIRHTHHARQRMQQRKVSTEQVLETLEAPDDVLAGDRDELIAIRRYGIHEIRVVYTESDRNTMVIYTVIKVKIHQ